ncbi:hypothetical protein BN1008_539 [Escherichia coli]|nr:hypothetical protein BN1008_539 [Escherichia coli]
MAAASSTTSQSACSSLANKASGAIKRNFSPANCASTSVDAFAGAVTIALPAIREMSCPANADLPRPRAAVTAATPGGMVISCFKSCCCSGCGAPVAGYQSVRGVKCANENGWFCRQRIASLSAVSTRLRCWTKCGVAIGSGQSLQRSESASGWFSHSSHTGSNKTSQLPAFNVPLSAAKAAASKPWRASNTACRNSRPSKVCSAEGEQWFSASGRGEIHSQSPGKASRNLRVCSKHQPSSPLNTSKRRIPSRFICAVNV